MRNAIWVVPPGKSSGPRWLRASTVIFNRTSVFTRSHGSLRLRDSTLGMALCTTKLESVVACLTPKLSPPPGFCAACEPGGCGAVLPEMALNPVEFPSPHESSSDLFFFDSTKWYELDSSPPVK